ncbi:hypothetical protein BASA50_006504 [Batrachochytrium salamandrivorans]|uniref:Ras GEF n=1 Tax=Batrachochytrium salamandrivorans TaxID=1357716 RepID=A0ABQ8F9M2_9FUNG|nr:hypothetical protein BASA50_006504 [Batrachochytrium salamandrivorans]KAH9245602.1 hypothetical protein BASA81_016894 [Batrachochytrium salamandrivorans]KAH9268461.1 hypothetical protein BASA83_009303 [Batrachochytrium salamandrivorans]
MALQVPVDVQSSPAEAAGEAVTTNTTTTAANDIAHTTPITTTADTASTTDTTDAADTISNAATLEAPYIDVVRALYDYPAADPSCLSLTKGDVIYVYFKDPSGWWEGSLRSIKGWFPSNYIEPMVQSSSSSLIDMSTPTDKKVDSDPVSSSLGVGRQRSGSMSNARTRLDTLTLALEQVMNDKKAFGSESISSASESANPNMKSGFTEDLTTIPSSPSLSPLPKTAAETISQSATESNPTSSFSHETLDHPAELISVAVSNSDLPPYWHRKTNISTGQVYFFNTHTNQTTYSIDEVRSAAPRRRSLIFQDKKFIANQEKLLPSLKPNANGSDWGSESLIDPKVNITWELLINNILKSIADLNYSAKNQIKSRYVDQTYIIVRAIRDMLGSSGTISVDSDVIKTHEKLATYHDEIMNTLSKLVMAAKVTSGMWPPPDASNRMRQQAGQVLLCVRHFVSVAQDASLILSHAPKSLLVTFDLKGIALSDRELVSRLENYSKTIMDKLADIVTQVSSNHAESAEYASLVRECVTSIGEMLSIIEDFRIDFGDDPRRLVEGLNTSKERLYMYVTGLVNHATVSLGGPFTPSDAMGSMVESTAQVMKAVENVIVASKLVIDHKDELGTLEWQPAESLQAPSSSNTKSNRLSNDSTGTSGADRSPDLANLQRRALSLSLLANMNERSHLQSMGVSRTPSASVIDTSVSTSSTSDVPTHQRMGPNHLTLPDMQRSFSASDSNLMVGHRQKQNQQNQQNRQQPHPLQTSFHHAPFQHPQRKQSIAVIHNRTSSAGHNSISIGNSNSNSSGVFTSPLQVSHPAPFHHQLGQRDSHQNLSSPNIPSTNAGHLSSTHPSPLRTASPYDFDEDRPRVNSFEGGQLKLKKFFGDGDVPTHVSTRISVDAGRPTFLNKDYRHEDLTFNMEGAINGGTFEALVERLTLHDQPVDPVFANAFLLTFHLFSTSEELFNSLVARYNMSPSPELSASDVKIWVDKKLVPAQIRVSNAFKTWLENHWVESLDDACLDMIYQFASTSMSLTHAPLATRLMDLVTKKINSDIYHHNTNAIPKFKRLTARSDEIPQPILPRNIKRFSLLDLDPIEIARQLTLIESQLYARIRPVELLKQEWAKKQQSVAVNVRAMSQMSTRIAGWVIASILSDPDAKRRGGIVKFFTKVADNCLEMSNFNSLMAIMTGLNSSTIARLKKTWDSISAKTKTMFENVQRVTNHARNYSEYRALLKRAPLPALPFLGLFLTDLTFTDDGNPDKRNEGRLINFDKYAKTARIIQDVQRYQLPFSFVDVAGVQEFLLEAVDREGRRDAQELYEISLAYEPREGDGGGGGGPLSATPSIGSSTMMQDDVSKDMENKIRMLERAGML